LVLGSFMIRLLVLVLEDMFDIRGLSGFQSQKNTRQDYLKS